MRRFLRHRPSPGVLVAVVGLLVGLGGTSLAASGGGSSGDEATTSAVRPIPTRGVKHKHLGRNSVQGDNVAANALGKDDINELDLDKVKSAQTADRADFANTAQDLEDEVLIPLTRAPFTAPVGGTTTKREGGNIVNLAIVGDTRYDLLCVISEETGIGGEGGGSDYDLPAGVQSEGEAEAKLIVWNPRVDLSFRGANGPRINVAAGEVEYNNTVGPRNFPGPTPNDNRRGEGEHQIVGASNRRNDEVRFHQTRFPGFAGTSGTIVVPNGSAPQIVDIVVGFNALGVIDECFAQGSIRPLQDD